MLVAPFDPREAHWELGQHLRRTGERRIQQIDPIPHLCLFLRIAAVSGFHPGHRRRSIGSPLVVARPHRHRILCDRNIVGQRHVGELLLRSRPQIHYHRAPREILKRQLVRIRMMAPRNQREMPVRRWVRGVDHCRLAHCLRPSCQRHYADLRRRVVIEEALVFGILQQILVGPRRRHPSQVLLHRRARRHFGMGWRCSAPRRNRQTQQAAAVRHPRARIAENPVQRHARNARRLPCCRIGGPHGQPRPRICARDQHKCHPLRIRRPLHVFDVRLRRQSRHRNLFPRGQRLELQSDNVRQSARSIRPRIESQTRQPQFRLRQVRNRQQPARLFDQQRSRPALRFRRNHHQRRRWRFQQIGDRLRRLLIRDAALCKRGSGHQHAGGEGKQRAQVHEQMSPFFESWPGRPRDSAPIVAVDAGRARGASLSAGILSRAGSSPHAAAHQWPDS